MTTKDVIVMGSTITTSTDTSMRSDTDADSPVPVSVAVAVTLSWKLSVEPGEGITARSATSSPATR